jgi:hypothetical protein
MTRTCTTIGRRLTLAVLLLSSVGIGTAAAQAGGHQHGKPDSARGGGHGQHGQPGHGAGGMRGQGKGMGGQHGAGGQHGGQAGGQRGAQGEEAMHGPSFDDAGFGPTLPMLTRMLDLTPAQVKQLEPLRATMLEESRAERRQAAAARQAMQDGQRARVGPDSMAVLRDRMQGAMQMLMPPRLRFAEAMKAILTPAQREMFDKHREEMMQQMGERMRKPVE